MSMGFPVPALEGAPVDMPVNLSFQTNLTISQFIIAFIVTVIVAKRSSNETRAVNLFLLAAAGCCFLLEAFADALLLIWHPTPGQWNIFHAYGHYVPIWVLPTLYWAYGAQAAWFLHDLRIGVTRVKLWKLFWFFAFTDVLFELPPLWFNVYTYYGPQPLAWPPALALPMYFPFGNAVVTVAAAVATLMAERHLDARRWPCLILPIALTAIFCATAMYGWPVSLTLNSDAPARAIQASGLLSIAISLLFMWMVANAFGAQSNQAALQTAD